MRRRGRQVKAVVDDTRLDGRVRAALVDLIMQQVALVVQMLVLAVC